MSRTIREARDANRVDYPPLDMIVKHWAVSRHRDTVLIDTVRS